MKPGPDTLPIEVLDRLRIATPLVASLEMSRAQAKATADEDKDLLVCLSALMAVHTTKGMSFRMVYTPRGSELGLGLMTWAGQSFPVLQVAVSILIRALARPSLMGPLK